MDTTIINNDLYLMLGPSFDCLHIRRSNEGMKGFEQFAWGNVQKVKYADLPPDNWFFHYHFTPEQMEHLPALGAMRNRDYFRNLLPQLRAAAIHPQQMLPLEQAMRLEEREEYMLQPLLNHPDMPLCSLLPVESNYIFSLSLARPLFYAYTAVKSSDGVLLFSPSIHGAGLFQGYMQQTADRFFDPQLSLSELSIFRLPAFDPKLKSYVDRFPRIRLTPIKDSQIIKLPPEAMAPGAALLDGMEVLRYDMKPTGENFSRLVFPASRTGLHCSVRNHDILRLLHIAQTGLLHPEIENESSSRLWRIFGSLSQQNASLAAIKQKAMQLLTELGPIRGHDHQTGQEHLMDRTLSLDEGAHPNNRLACFAEDDCTDHSLRRGVRL